MFKTIIKVVFAMGLIGISMYLSKQESVVAYDKGYVEGIRVGTQAGELAACEVVAVGLQNTMRSGTSPVAEAWSAVCLSTNSHPLIGISNELTGERHVFDLQFRQIGE